MHWWMLLFRSRIKYDHAYNKQYNIREKKPIKMLKNICATEEKGPYMVNCAAKYIYRIV